MVIIKIKHDNSSYPPQYIIVGDEDPYSDAEKLFTNHFKDSCCEIRSMERIGNGRDVINSWAQ